MLASRKRRTYLAFVSILMLLIVGLNAFTDLSKRSEQKGSPALPVFRLLASGKFFIVNSAGLILPDNRQPSDLPLVRINELIDNESLRKQTLDLFSSLKNLKRFSSSRVSEVHFDKIDGFNIWLADGETNVKLGTENLRMKASLVNRVIEHLDEEQLRARVIDARFKKKVVVRPRNDP